MMRIGIGHDTHRLVANRPLILGGIQIDYPKGLAGHSDADVILHAITDALLGAAGLGDIGDAYPDDDPQYKNANSSQFLQETNSRIQQLGWQIQNIDVILFAEEPKLGPLKLQIRQRIAALLQIPVDAINLKAKTGEGIGNIGRGEAISCQTVVLIAKNN